MAAIARRNPYADPFADPTNGGLFGSTDTEGVPQTPTQPLPNDTKGPEVNPNTNLPANPPAVLNYAPIQGFDTSKLQDPTYQNDKYTGALRDFSSYLGGGGSATRGNLDGAIAYAKANGFPNAKAVGDDSIDYGDGRGPIDVVTGSGQNWFANTEYPGQPGYNPSGSTDLTASGNLAAMGIGGSSGAPAAPNGPSGSSGFGDLKSVIASLFPGGLFNQDIVNRESTSAADTLNRQRTSQKATDQAYLADRGLIGSGPEVTALAKLNDNTDASYQDAISNIYANEENNADSRMIQALQLATGMTETEAQQAIDSYNAATSRQSVGNQFTLGEGQLDLGRLNANNEFTLGQGNLAVSNLNAENNYNLGLDNYDLNRTLAGYGLSNATIQQLIQIAQQLQNGATTSAGGFAQ